MDDFELIKGCISGDKKSWDIFVEQYSRLIYDSMQKAAGRTFEKYGTKMSNDEVNEIIAELHNDVFLALLEDDYKALRKFEGKNRDTLAKCTLASYLRTIAVNKTIDYWRKIKPIISIDEEAEVDDQGEDNKRRSNRVADFEIQKYFGEKKQKDAIRTTEELFLELGEEEKRFCRLCFIENQEPAYIAKEFGISIDNFYVRKQRILNRLRQIARAKGIC